MYRPPAWPRGHLLTPGVPLNLFILSTWPTSICLKTDFVILDFRGLDFVPGRILSLTGFCPWPDFVPGRIQSMPDFVHAGYWGAGFCPIPAIGAPAKVNHRIWYARQLVQAVAGKGPTERVAPAFGPPTFDLPSLSTNMNIILACKKSTKPLSYDKILQRMSFSHNTAENRYAFD